MKENIYRSENLCEKSPDWYWKNGLHDAEIITVEYVQLAYDYKEKHPIRNSMKLFLNASQSLYDMNIKSITFFNYKVMTFDFELENCYWLQDTLSFDNRKYTLNITITDGRSPRIFTVKFDNATVERSN